MTLKEQVQMTPLPLYSRRESETSRESSEDVSPSEPCRLLSATLGFMLTCQAALVIAFTSS